MSNFSLKNLAHHAYCLVGDDFVRDELFLILENDHGILRKGNQDFYERKYEIFTIDHARELKLSHEMRPVVDDGKKIFVISVDGITIEAQNALLKLLEEPASYAHFFLIVPATDLLLPTIKSRLCFVEDFGKDASNAGKDEINLEAKKFLSLDLAKRLEFVKKFVDDISKEKRTKRDAIDFLNSIQKIIREKKGVKEGLEALKAVDLACKYINDRSPSLKMLLEYVALSV